MKVAIGADHIGVILKRHLTEWLVRHGHEVRDFGTWTAESADYPDVALPVAAAVATGGFECGILICATGAGMSIAANKVPGIRAAVGTSADQVGLLRAHNAANVLAIAARYSTAESAEVLVETFLRTPFEGGRHARRVDKITAAERRLGHRDAAEPQTG